MVINVSRTASPPRHWRLATWPSGAWLHVAGWLHVRGSNGSLEATQVVTPWEVEAKKGGKINYDKLIVDFGCSRMNADIVSCVERLTNLHWLTMYLQDAFKVPLVIQLTDDEKFMWKDMTEDEARRLARENAKDIIACGFDISRTVIFADFDYVGGEFYQNMVHIAKCVTLNQERGIFGFVGEDHIGKVLFPLVQAASSFPTSFPHLFGDAEQSKDMRCLPCAIDQDPYFRMTRDVAPRIGFNKPALIESLFFPALQGESGKISASDASSAIYVTDNQKQIKDKINKAFSGGSDTAEEQRKHGANIENDIAVKYLGFFLGDDKELERIKKECGSGKLLAGEVKKILINVLVTIVERHHRVIARNTCTICYVLQQYS